MTTTPKNALAKFDLSRRAGSEDLAALRLLIYLLYDFSFICLGLLIYLLTTSHLFTLRLLIYLLTTSHLFALRLLIYLLTTSEKKRNASAKST